jgi:hypothetical protein
LSIVPAGFVILALRDFASEALKLKREDHMKSNNISKTYLLNIGKLFTIAAAFVLFTFAATQVNAQIDIPSNSSINQCDPQGAPLTSTCHWQNGNLGANTYSENDSVAYRVIMPGLVNGQSYKVTITFGSIISSTKHAQDYLTTFTSTVPNADPCQTGLCTVGSPNAFLAIPHNPDLDSGCNACPVGSTGNFTLWGGTALALASPGTPYSNASAGSGIDTSITLNFTANGGTAVLSFGAHVATRFNWGPGNSAGSVNGSSYHVDAGGHNDSMKTSTIFLPAVLVVVKHVTGPAASADPTVDATQAFPFTATYNAGQVTFPAVSSFNLTDITPGDSPSTTVAQSSDTQIINLLGPYPATGTILEGALVVIDPDTGLPHPSGYSYDSVSCSTPVGGVVTSAQGGFQITSPSFQTGFTFNLNVGNFMTCNVHNLFGVVTAATASLSGKVTTRSGKGIKGATVTATDSTGKVSSAKTDAKGNYTITKLEDGDFFDVSVSASGYTFLSSPIVSLKISGDKTQDFTATQ